MLTQHVLREEPQLTQVAFGRLLEWLDEGLDSHGERYLEMRRRLVAYFDRRNRPDADELADETLSRIGRTLEQDTVTKADAIDLLRRNSEAAANGIRALSDAQLDRAAAISLNADAPLTCQFFLEDHPVRHSYHHLARIRAALKR